MVEHRAGAGPLKPPPWLSPHLDAIGAAVLGFTITGVIMLADAGFLL